MSEEEQALVAKHRGTPDYADGYDDGLNGRPLDFVSEAFDCGHRAGQRAAKLFEANGFSRTTDGGFSIRLGVA